MKQVILFLSLLVSGFVYGNNPFTLTVTEAEGNTYPNGIQTLGNDSNLVQPKGGFKARVINWVHVDTFAANLQRIKNYPGAQIFTSSDNKFRYRNATATGWLESGSSTFYNSNIGIGYRLAVPNTNNIKTVFGAGIITIDSTSNADALTITGTEVDGSTTNELQALSVTGTTSPVVTLSIGGGSFTLVGAGINTFGVAGSTITITGTEVDGSVTNELQTLSIAGTTTVTNTLSNGGGSFSITGAGIASISRSGTAITVTATEVNNGTVTSVQVSGGTTGLTYSGGPITSSGTITMAGTLIVANGGTGANTFTSNGVIYGNSTSALQVTAAGTNGQLFIGNTSSAPTWGNTVSNLTAFTAGLSTSSTAINSNLYVTSGTFGATATAAGVQVEGSTNNFARIFMNGSTSLAPSAGYAAGYFTLGASAIDEAGSGTHPLFYTMALQPPSVIPGSATVSNTATLYIAGAPSVTVAGENSAIWLAQGNLRMGKAGSALGTFTMEGNTSGKITFQSAAAAGTYTLTWPVTDGNNGEVLRTNGSGVLDWVAPTAYTSNSGLTMTANNTQLGGALLNSPTISGSTLYGVYFTGSYGTGTNPGVINVTQSGTSGYAINATNNGTGGGAINATVSTGQVAVTATATDTYGVQASATSGYAINGTATSGIGVYGASQTGTGGTFVANPSSTNTIVPVININRSSSGTGATGIGGSIDFGLEANDGFNYTSNQIITKWTTGTAASRVSEFSITGVNAAVTSTIFKLAGSGQPTFGKLGIGTFTGTPAYSLSVDASGNIIETSAPLTLASGRYTPSGGSSSNVNSFGPSVATYLRVGNSVTVSGSVSIDIANCSSSASVNMSLPIATAMSSSNMLAGPANEIDFATASGVCAGDASADEVRITILFCCSCSGSVTATFWYTYTYFIE